MPLFPERFIEELKLHADIVQIVQDVVPLKRAGTTFKGLCPFHPEKTPSFHVHRERGFFHCFGCGVGGDVFKFLELHHKVSFPEAVRLVAQRLGVAVPEPEAEQRGARAQAAEREALVTLHERALDYFRRQLASPAGTRARQQLRDRGLSASTIDALGLGYALPGRDNLARRLLGEGFARPLVVKSGLVIERADGQLVDRFRGRIMIPIRRENGAVVAFGGRACEAGQEPKYLNSPETPIYTKSRVLYGFDLTKEAVRRLGYAVLVEGYFDFAQAWQAGIEPVVATCGTALTVAQARLLRRYAPRVVLSFDPDRAGERAAVRSCDLLVGEGFEVEVAVLPPGTDPDILVRTEGAAAYLERLGRARPYLEFLLDRTAAQFDLRRDEARRAFVAQMLEVAARIPDAAARDQFADRVAHKARITEEAARTALRRAAVQRKTTVEPALPHLGALRPAEKGLLWALAHEPAAALAVLVHLEPPDFEGLTAAPILGAARGLAHWPADTVPQALAERLTEEEAQLLAAVAAEPAAPAPPDACGRALVRLRLERERAELQRRIEGLQARGDAGATEEIAALWARKKDLLQQLEALKL